MESNVGQMRKTLEVVRDALSTISAHEDDIGFVRAWISMTKEEVAKALALPLRNCDRFNAPLDAIHGWEDYLEKHPELPPSSKTDGAMLPWLFAHATEEGGAR